MWQLSTKGLEDEPKVDVKVIRIQLTLGLLLILSHYNYIIFTPYNHPISTILLKKKKKHLVSERLTCPKSVTWKSTKLSTEPRSVRFQSVDSIHSYNAFPGEAQAERAWPQSSGMPSQEEKEASLGQVRPEKGGHRWQIVLMEINGL